MNSRIALVLKAKNISPSQLADDLGVQRSGISHIINGRNKPSLDFIQKLIRLFPDISMQWILFGEGPMMNPYPVNTHEVSKEKVSERMIDEKPKPRIMELFSTEDDQVVKESIPEKENSIEDIDSAIDIQENITDESLPESNSRKVEFNEKIKIPAVDPKQVSRTIEKPETRKFEMPVDEMENKKPDLHIGKVRKITKILVFYSDRTFVEYNPGDE